MYIGNGAPDWDGFYDACDGDSPLWPVIRVLRALQEFHNGDSETYLVTGRRDNTEDKTRRWMHDFCIPFDALIMRRSGDYRSDWVLKREWWRGSHIAREAVAAVFEDRNSTVDMWRGEGLTVFQHTGDGDF